MMEIFASLTKIEEQEDGSLIVSRIASTEARDSAGEVVTAAAMKAALPDYLQFPALREMHGLSAAGTTLDASVGDDNATRIVAKVVDPVAIAKVNSGTYRGFSIGGKIKGRDPNDRTVVTKIDLREISLVDRPCNPEARLDMWKADIGQDKDPDMTDAAGAPAPEAAGAAEVPADVEGAAAPVGEKTAAAVAAPEAEAAKADLPAADQAAAPASVETPQSDAAKADVPAAELEPAAAPAPAARAEAAVASLEAAVAKASGAADLAKSLWTIGDFSDLLLSLSFLVQDYELDALFAGDASPVPAKLRDAMTVLATVFKEMAAEEADKLISAGKAKKAAAAEAIGKASESDTLAKVAADADDLRKAVAERDEQLAKFAERVEPLIKTVTDLSTRLAKVEAEPAPPKTAGSTLAKGVTKEEDAAGHGAPAIAPAAVELNPDNIAKVLASMSEDERANTLMKAALARPMPLKI